MAYIQKNNPFKFSPVKQTTGDVSSDVDASVHPDWKTVLGDVDLLNKEKERKEREAIPKSTKQKLRSLEEKIDLKLGYPGKRAWDKAIEYRARELRPTQEQKADRFRHALAGAYTSEKVGIVGANILGLAHEIIAPNTPSEHKSDLINNAIGSIVGRIPFINEEQTVKTIKWLNDRGWLSEYEIPDVGDPDAEKLYPGRFGKPAEQKKK